MQRFSFFKDLQIILKHVYSPWYSILLSVEKSTNAGMVLVQKQACVFLESFFFRRHSVLSRSDGMQREVHTPWPTLWCVEATYSIEYPRFFFSLHHFSLTCFSLPPSVRLIDLYSSNLIFLTFLHRISNSTLNNRWTWNNTKSGCRVMD